jgi:uncharacterized protein YqhQ
MNYMLNLAYEKSTLGEQGMEIICEHQHYFSPLFPQCGPSHVLVIIITNKVILFLDHIHKKILSELDHIYSRILCGNFLPVSFPPMFDMGESLKECEGDLFPLKEIVNKEIIF